MSERKIVKTVIAMEKNIIASEGLLRPNTLVKLESASARIKSSKIVIYLLFIYFFIYY